PLPPSRGGGREAGGDPAGTGSRGRTAGAGGTLRKGKEKKLGRTFRGKRMGYLVNLCRRAAPAALLLVAAGSAHASSPPEPVGWVETARIFPGDMRIMAKLDTGALSSSINAHDITEFERNGRRWVRFTVVNRAGDRQTMELPLVRNVLIKEHGGEKDQRPVVKMGICIG